MAVKLKKYSDLQISAMLDSQSDSDTQQESKKVSVKPNKRREVRLRSKEDDQDDTSDAENIFDHVKFSLPKKNVLINEKVPLKIKLRRSTEQSMYKIDTDSEYERPARKSRVGVLKQSKKNSNDDIKNDSTNVTPRKSQPMSSQDENDTPQRSNRIRRPPLRLSYYHCGTLPSLNFSANSPNLRNAKNINYNEDNLFLRSEKMMRDLEEKSTAPRKKERNYSSDSSTSTRGSETKPLTASTRNNKRNRTLSVRDNENDSDVVTKAVKAKARKSNAVDTNKIDKVDRLPKKIEIIDITQDEPPITPVTPAKTSRRVKQPVVKSNKKEEKSQNIESHSEEESLIATYKRTRKASTRKNISTPQRDTKESENIVPSTPKSRGMKCSTLTPSMGKRNIALLKPATPLQEARSRLHVSAVPKSLPCREEEFNNIFTFLKGKLLDKSGGCIYISGVPGTGKTATVNEVVRCLQKLISKGELDDFDYVAINGMKLTEPRQSYVQILKQLTGKTFTWEQAYRMLEKRFHAASSKMTLLLVDELDFLCTKRQDVVYNLLDWPAKASAQLVVITIANTMDLPERVLMGRVTSRLGLTRLTFQPYNYKQLQEIVVTRLKDFDSFRSEAIQLVARKVSAVSGDARRALDICRRAMEIAESRDAETISLQDVSQAVSEMIATAKIQAIKHCSKMEQIFLQAVSAEVTRTSVEEVHFKDAYKQLESLCSFDGIKVPTVTEILAVCGRLGASRLLICEHSRNDIYQKILLNVSTDDIHYALQEPETN